MTYQIHHYPAELIDVVHLDGGKRVVVRPVLPQDADLTGAFFRDLSAPSRYERFMTSMREVPADLMRRFTEIDYADHLALVAEVFVDGRETVIAEARYVRGSDPTVAEFAVSVAEAWQGAPAARQARVPRGRGRRAPYRRRDTRHQRAHDLSRPQGRLHHHAEPGRARPDAAGEDHRQRFVRPALQRRRGSLPRRITRKRSRQPRGEPVEPRLACATRPSTSSGRCWRMSRGIHRPRGELVEPRLACVAVLRQTQDEASCGTVSVVRDGPAARGRSRS